MSGASSHRYLIALGSNMRVAGIGGPRVVIARALERLEAIGVFIRDVSPMIESAPVGPSARRYANAVAEIESTLCPSEMLALLQTVEREFGRKRRGQPWRSRPLDLDIVLWNGGAMASDDLILPHPRFRERNFVLGPAAAIAPRWTDPISGFSIAQLHARLTRSRPLPSARRSQA